MGIFRGAPGVVPTKPCRETLTNRPIWTEMYGTLLVVYKYEYLMLAIFSVTAVLFSDTTCIYFPTPGVPGRSYKARS